MQFLAMVTMLIDHIGIVFFPDNQTWRIIGRIAFPIYAYGILQGYIFTRDRGRYIKRLAIIGAAAQIPYMLMVGLQLNVVFTFIVVLMVLQLLDQAQNNIHYVLSAIMAALLEALPFSYGAYALVLILCYKYLPTFWVVACHIILNYICSAVFGWSNIQAFSILATLIIVFPSIKSYVARFKAPRWIWLSFYPAHMAILVLVSFLSGLNFKS